MTIKVLSGYAMLSQGWPCYVTLVKRFSG